MHTISFACIIWFQISLSQQCIQKVSSLSRKNTEILAEFQIFLNIRYTLTSPSAENRNKFDNRERLLLPNCSIAYSLLKRGYCNFKKAAAWIFSIYGLFIRKTCLYNVDPLKPHFYIVKLGFTGVYIIFRIFAQNIDCGYSLEPPHRGGSNKYPQSMFLSRNMKKYQNFFLSENFPFLVVRCSIYMYLNRRVFVMS